MGPSGEDRAARIRELEVLVRGRLRTVRFAVFNDGTSPARDLMAELATTPKGQKVVADVVAMFQHLADNVSHAQLKRWEGDVQQITKGKYRFEYVEHESPRTGRTLSLFYAFKKSSKRTPRKHTQAIARLRQRMREEGMVE